MLAPSTSDRKQHNDLHKQVRPHLDALNEFLAEETSKFEPEIREQAEYCLSHRGKQLRPALLFFSGWSDRANQHFEDLVQAAATVELVHQATLVHDDILDGAQLRHNHPTLKEKHDPRIAVLLGDALFAHALKLASDFSDVYVCRVVSQATRRVCTGEISQSLEIQGKAHALDDYYRIIDLKTAELFRVSGELGARLANYSAEFVSAAAEFGRRVGMAYQIYDDLVDITGEEHKIGKTLGTDLANGKMTLPTHMLLQRMKAEGQNYLVEQILKEPLDVELCAAYLDQYDIPLAVQSAFHEQLDLAMASLEPYVDLPPYAPLAQMVLYVREYASSLAKM